jgi:hypothetical protein
MFTMYPPSVTQTASSEAEARKRNPAATGDEPLAKRTCLEDVAGLRSRDQDVGTDDDKVRL